MKNRTLFLCYPDEQEAIAAPCLENFQGEYIIHVGELITGAGTLFGYPQAPFGRTSSSEFQVDLAETFHCLLVANLQNRWPYSKDCISVWKRTNFVSGKDHAEDVASSSSSSSSSSSAAAAAAVVETKKAGKKSNKKQGNDDEAVEFISINDLALLREAALDQQYSEDKESSYANIPEDECITVDRACPKLAHLL